MIMGAIGGFAAAYVSGSALLGVVAAVGAGVGLSLHLRLPHPDPRLQPGGDGARPHPVRPRALGAHRGGVHRPSRGQAPTDPHPRAERPPPRRPGDLRPGRDRLRVGRAHRPRRVGARPHPARSRHPGDGRQPPLRPRPRLQRHRGALRLHRLRRSHRRPRRRLPLARLHPPVDREHDRGPGLDRARPRGVLHLGAAPGRGRRLSLRHGLDHGPLRAGDRHQHRTPVPRLAPLPHHHRRPGGDLREPAPHEGRTRPACLGQPFVPDR